MLQRHYMYLVHDKTEDLRINRLKTICLALFGTLLLAIYFAIEMTASRPVFVEVVSIAGCFSIWEAVDTWLLAAKAVAFGEALHPRFKVYQQQVLDNCAVLARTLMDAGFDLVSGGTENHLMLVDLTNKDITGKDAEHALDMAGITVNKNTVPFETRSPFVTSGIRIGTAALTTRGMKEDDMRQVGRFIVEALEHHTDEAALTAISKRVEEFARAFPIFAW